MDLEDSFGSSDHLIGLFVVALARVTLAALTTIFMQWLTQERARAADLCIRMNRVERLTVAR